MGNSGKIIPNGVLLKEHEMKTVLFLTEMGYDIEFIPKSDEEGHHTPDILIDGIKWEMKSPTGDSKYTMQNNLQEALKQSCYIILDLRRAKRKEEKCLREIEKEFTFSKRIKAIKVITKGRKLLDFSR